ncbi:MAG: sodium:proton antiporter [Pseudonocardia sp. SCN 72-86]|nr:MAG: sodium:proton antiporter [Pseudonocardia sp. SCN 72-86]
MTTMSLAMAAVVAVLYSVGFYLLLQRSLMRVLLGVVVLGHGANLLLQLAGGPPARPPILDGNGTEGMADPLPQALALTAVVITFAMTTYLLALGYRSWVLVGHDEVQDDLEDRRIARRRTVRASMGEEVSDHGEETELDPGSAAASDDPVASVGENR